MRSQLVSTSSPGISRSLNSSCSLLCFFDLFAALVWWIMEYTLTTSWFQNRRALDCLDHSAQMSWTPPCLAWSASHPACSSWWYCAAIAAAGLVSSFSFRRQYPQNPHLRCHKQSPSSTFSACRMRRSDENMPKSQQMETEKIWFFNCKKAYIFCQNP